METHPSDSLRPPADEAVAGLVDPPWILADEPGPTLDLTGEHVDTSIGSSLSFEGAAVMRDPAKPWWRRLFASNRHAAAANSLNDALMTPIGGGQRTIAVVSTKGGVGKTTTSAMIGHCLAAYRGDRVVAMDTNADAGSLGYRIPRQTTKSTFDLFDDHPSVNTYSLMRAYTSVAPSRLEVLAAPDNPHAARAVGVEEARTLVNVLRRFYSLVIADCGTGILDPATRAVVAAADQLVVVSHAAVDSVRAVTFLLEHLDGAGFGHLTSDAVIAINAVNRQHKRVAHVDVDAIVDHFAALVRDILIVPWDPSLAAGDLTDLHSLQRTTRSAYIHLTATIAAGFAS